MRLRSKPAALLLVLAWAGVAGAQTPAEESALLTLWKAHNPSNHEAAARTCAAFEKQFPESPLVVVSHSIVGWHALAAGDRGPAVQKLFEACLSDKKDALSESATTMGRRWLSRLDRESVKAGLKLYYADHIGYPASLDELARLPEKKRPPLNDRWGRPWRYRLSDLKRIRGTTAQKYVLESVNVDRDNEIDEALAKPYDVATLLKPQKVLSRDAGHESVSFAAGREPVVLTVGSRYRGVTLAYVGQTILILTDDDHWLVLPCP